MKKRIPKKGDGLLFHRAYKVSGMLSHEIYTKMKISSTSLSRMFDKEVFDNDEKGAAAKALGKKVEEIFGEMEKLTTPKKKVPLIGDAMAGNSMQINVDDNSQQMEYIDVGDLLRDSEAAFTVYGSSMVPNYPSGCILGIRQNYDSFIQPGEIYLLVTRSNRVFKRLFLNESGTGYYCHSDNLLTYDSGPMKGKPYYPDFEVPFEDVISIHDVVGVIKRTRNSNVIMRQV